LTAIKALLFPGILIIVEALLILCLFNWIGDINQNCISSTSGLPYTIDEPTLLNYLSVVWNSLLAVLTLGLSTLCGFPAIAVTIVAAFNTILYTFLIYGIIFLIRGSS
jgi:hypothetical protein